LREGKILAAEVFDRTQTKKLAAGTLATPDNQIDTTTGTIKLKAIFTNEDESLFPNQFVNARLLVDTLHDATLVPNTVIQRNADSASLICSPQTKLSPCKPSRLAQRTHPPPRYRESSRARSSRRTISPGSPMAQR
jgi:multidrug efflux system membrane fusion protein